MYVRCGPLYLTVNYTLIYAGDIFSAQYQAFPAADRIPVSYKRSPNPGLVFISTR